MSQSPKFPKEPHWLYFGTPELSNLKYYRFQKVIDGDYWNPKLPKYPKILRKCRLAIQSSKRDLFKRFYRSLQSLDLQEGESYNQAVPLHSFL